MYNLRRFSTSSKCTVLPNGLKVVSLPHTSSGHFVSAGVLVDAGSRFENSRTAGTTHLLDKLTFKSTEKYRQQELVEKVELMGGQFQCLVQRELIMYQASI